jgi:hypothetical protein
MKLHPGAMEALPRAIEARFVAMKTHLGAIVARPGTMGLTPGAMEAQSGATKAHIEDVCEC